MQKEYILQEIKRTAEANEGVPLGWRKFVSETGIKQSEWLGKIWARWSEALREAGFTPNQLQGAYEKTELLEQYSRLAQDLGRLPTANDLRLKSRNDPEFPNSSTFERLGAKADFLRELLEFCRNREGLEELVHLCEACTLPSKDKPEADSGEMEIGFVYLIKSGRYYKIGQTNSIGRREYELGIQLPEKVTTVHVIRTDDPIGIEAYWHKRFEAKRMNGEWFALDSPEIAAFKRRKFM